MNNSRLYREANTASDDVVGVINSLISEIEELETENDKLKNRIEKLETIVDDLKDELKQ